MQMEDVYKSIIYGDLTVLGYCPFYARVKRIPAKNEL